MTVGLPTVALTLSESLWLQPRGWLRFLHPSRANARRWKNGFCLADPLAVLLAKFHCVGVGDSWGVSADARFTSASTKSRGLITADL